MWARASSARRVSFLARCPHACIRFCEPESPLAAPVPGAGGNSCGSVHDPSVPLPRPAACGDVMKLQIKVDENGNIVDSCFKTFGCGSAIASSSVATEWVKGRTLDDVLTIKNQDIAKHLSLPPVKLHCSMLAEDAIKAAVRDIQAKRAAAKGGDAGTAAEASAATA